MQEKSNLSLQRTAVDSFYKYHSQIFFALLAVTPLLIWILNRIQTLTLYENTMIVIGWVQAVIIAYLSFKIFEVGKRDSELPVLWAGITNVEEIDSPHEDHRVVRCTVGFKNRSYGRAKITDVDINAQFNQRQLERNKDPSEGNVFAGFPEGKPIPAILDKGEVLEVTFQVNSYSYLDEISLEITEESLGKVTHQLLLSEISDRLFLGKGSETN